MRLHYYCYKDKFPKEFVVNQILELNKTAKAKKIPWLEIRTYSLLANYLFHYHQEYALGFEYYERTLQLLDRLNAKEYPLKKICVSQIASAYLSFKEYDQAIHYLRKTTQIESSLDNYSDEMHILNNLGFSYRKLYQLDSSYYYFEKTLIKAKQHNDSIWIGISSGNLGENYYLINEFDKAKPLLELDVKIAIKNKDWGLASNALVLLSHLELEKNNLITADSLANQASYYAHKSKQYSRLAKIYPLQSKIATHLFKPELASVYLDSTLMAKDSLAILYDGKKILLAKQRIQFEKQKIKEQKEQQANLRQLWIRNGLIVGLILVTLILGLIYNQYLLRVKNKAHQLLLEKQSAEKNLLAAKKRLEDFKQALLKKNEAILTFQKQNGNSGADKNAIPFEEQLKKSSILTDEDSKKFLSLFNEVYPGFLNRLKKQYPRLTPAETRYIALSRLELNTNEMALMLGVGNSAVRQIKSHLLKKIELGEYPSIYEFSVHI